MKKLHELKILFILTILIELRAKHRINKMDKIKLMVK